MILSRNNLSVDIILPKAEEVRQLFRMPLHLLLRSASFTLDSPVRVGRQCCQDHERDVTPREWLVLC